jgi:polysaccharide pyruvyl transferase WcaK-like protein
MINLYSIRPKGFNIGNDAIYLGLSHFIRKAFKDNYNVISLPATTKYETQKKGGITAQTVYEINHIGDGVIVGGGNLYENNELDIDATALKALEKPLMVFSVSRGKIYNNKLELVDRTNVMPDSKIKMLHEKVDFSLSRDQATKTHLDTIGCKNILGGCPTLFINEMPLHYVPVLDSDITDALISIRTPDLMSVPVRFQYGMRDQLIEIVSLLKGKGYKNVKLLCHDHRDISFAQSFLDFEYLYTEDIYTYLSLLKNTKLNITYRLHSFLPCISMGIPAIKISYDQRALSLLETLGMGDWNIDLVKNNVVKEIENRIQNIGELEVIKEKNRKEKWPAIKSVIESNFAEFARAVINSK